jgi:hypothetical protein
VAAEIVFLVVFFGFLILLTGGLLVQGYRDGSIQERNAELRRERKVMPGSSKALVVLGGVLLLVGALAMEADDPAWWMWSSLPAGLAAFVTGFVLEGRARRRREAGTAPR